ncbi:MAG: UMP kinase [Rhizobiaceae bacterium]|nr:UMP kinase [Rhizobiaceae bacterium]MBL4695320.1 UMP kinase [Rhizobiaceae bacterium]
MTDSIKYKRVLLKVSGEALMGDQGFGIDPSVTKRIAGDVAEAQALGVATAIVVGGGNIFRGVSLAAKGADRVSGDHMGMLATVMNAIGLRMALEDAGLEAVVLSAIAMPEICENFSQRVMNDYLAEQKIVIFAGGTGNPYFTTDTAAALRACEMGADALFKGTQVDGIYSADPKKDPNAERFDTITHSEILDRGLEVMDATAVSLSKDENIPIIVFSIHEAGGYAKILKGEGRCTTVHGN